MKKNILVLDIEQAISTLVIINTLCWQMPQKWGGDNVLKAFKSFFTINYAPDFLI